MVRSILAIVLAAVIGGAGSRSQSLQPPPISNKPPSDSEIAANVGRLFKGYEEAGFFNGAVLVARGDRVLFEGAAGTANPETATANSVQSRFRIALLSQLF